MLNRRKLQTNSDEQLADDDYQALLQNDSSSQTINVHHLSQTNNNVLTYNWPTQSGQSGCNPTLTSTSFLEQQSAKLLPTVNRKSRNKSPEPDIRIKLRHTANANYIPNSTTFGNQQYINESIRYEDNYELTTRGNIPSHSRSIEVPISDSNFRDRTDFVYYTVQPGDTLHNLSVRYSCPVASIKRLNNLWSDQEIYALTRIKLPAGKLRLIADAIGEVTDTEKQQQYNPTTSQSISTKSNESCGTQNIPNYTSETTSPVYSTNLETPSFQPPNRGFGDDLHQETYKDYPIDKLCERSIFQNFDSNIEKAKAAALSYNDNANAIMQSLALSGNIVAEEDDLNKNAITEAESLINDMSDYGLSYSGLILFIFIVCLICPLAYVIYLEETHIDSSNKAL